MQCSHTFKPRWDGDTERPCTLPVQYHMVQTTDAGTREWDACNSHAVDDLHALLDVPGGAEIQLTIRGIGPRWMEGETYEEWMRRRKATGL